MAYLKIKLNHFIYAIAFISLSAFSQSKYITKTGIVGFEASVPSFEEVKATNNSVTAIINTSNGEFAALVLVKGFRFKNALMEEHFNENYAESDQYPKAIFKGQIVDFSMEKLDATNKFKINGELTFHARKVPLEAIEVKITYAATANTIELNGSFTLLASDFDIIIPKIVRKKVSNEVDVSFNFKLDKK